MLIHTLADVIQALEKNHNAASPPVDRELVAMNDDEHAKALYETLWNGLLRTLSEEGGTEPCSVTPDPLKRAIDRVGQYLERHTGDPMRYFFVISLGLPRFPFSIDVSMYLESAPNGASDGVVRQLIWTITSAKPGETTRIDCGAWPTDTSRIGLAVIDLTSFVCKRALDKVGGN